MYYLGIDIGGTTIKAGLVDETCRVLASGTAPTIVDDLNGFLSKLADLIRGFQNSAPVAAIGIGIPGLRSRTTHIIEISPNIPCLDNVNLERLVENQVQIPIVTENDANAGAYGEFVCGVAKGVQHFVYLTLGTGLGSGIVLDGQLFRGGSGYAGEVGHSVIEPDGRTCTCGSRGCVETIVSASGMVLTAKEKGRPDLATSRMIYQAAAQGDATACEIFEETGRYLGIACANLMNILNPDMIVLGGGVMASGEMLIRPALEEARLRAFPSSFKTCQIVQSRLWPESGIIGAAMLAKDQ